MILASVDLQASHIGSAAALQDDDLIYAQYREAGVLLWRGFSLHDFINQCYGNAKDIGINLFLAFSIARNAFHIMRK